MSRKLELDFMQTSPFALSKFTWSGLSVLLFGLMLTMFVLQNHQVKLAEQREALLELNQLQQQVQQISQVKAVSTDISSETKVQIEDTVKALTMPWNALFVAIEKSDIHEVALLSLEPNSKKQLVVLKGQAKNLASVIKYIHQLEQQPMLGQVYLQKHNVDEADAFKPVNFTLTAQWYKGE